MAVIPIRYVVLIALILVESDPDPLGWSLLNTMTFDCISGLVLSGLGMLGLNNYNVVQVVQGMAYVLLFIHYLIDSTRHDFNGLLVRLVVMIHLIYLTVLLLSLKRFREENGDLRSVEFYEDVYQRSDKWALTWATQFVIWTRTITCIRSYILVIRLVQEICIKIVHLFRMF